MMLFLIAAFTAAGANDQSPDEIVVTARPGKCVVEMARRPPSKDEHDRSEKHWPLGTPVRIIKPQGADDHCLTKIMFELARKGVTHADFVERTEDK